MAFTQTGRALRITTPLGPDGLLLERLDGEENVSNLFHFHLDLLSEKPDIDPAALLGEGVTVEIDFADETRFIHGIIARFAQTSRGERLTRYEAEMVPALWTASLVEDSAIHQQAAVPDIVAEVLDGLGIKCVLSLTGQYEPRNYTVQYREESLDFVSRLMEEEGIFYYFGHARGEHILRIADNSAQTPEIPAQTKKIVVGDTDRVPGSTPAPRVFNVLAEQSMVSGKYTLWDHNFQLPGKNLEASQPVAEGKEKLEIYEYPGGFAMRFDGIDSGGAEKPSELQKIYDDNARVAGLRARALATPHRVLRGESNYPMLTAGHRVSLDRHYRPDFNAEYFITSVRHSASIENYEGSDGAPFRYTASFACIPSGVLYTPPLRTPAARVSGAQTATVVGPSGSEIYTDKFGRVKVQFHWDRKGRKDDSASCWLRVSTPWAGKNWGMIAIPRVGTEVVVDFLEGDPDRPIITGMVYNPDSMPPYELPKNMTQSGIKTRSTQQGDAATFNELRFEDKKDAEEIYLHAEKDLNAIVENNETRKVGFEKKDKGDQAVEIFNNQTLKVGAGAADAADGSQTVDIYKDQTITLEKGHQTITLKEGDRTVTLEKGNESVAIKMGNREVEVSQGNDALTIKQGNLTTKLDMGNVTLELGLGNVDTKAKAGSINDEAMQGIELKVGQSSVKLDQSGVTIKGMTVKIEGQVSTEVKGLMAKVDGSAMLTLKGGVTMIN